MQPFLWKRPWFPIALSLLLLLLSLVVTSPTAQAATAAQTSASVHHSQTAISPAGQSIKPATRAWLQTQVATSFAPAPRTMSAIPNLLTCQQNENCSCPSGIATSQYYQCEWYYGFWPFSGGVLSLSYALDPNLPSSFQTWAIDGANLWVNSAANVYYYQGGSLSSSNVEIDAWHGGANCGGVWGHTTPNGPPISHVHVYLNVDNANCSNSGGWQWITTAAHELGHAFGLEHNQWCSGGGTSGCMLMNTCGSCTYTPHAPQSMDIAITNAMYPPNEVSPTRYSYCSGIGWGYYLDKWGYNQSGVSSSSENIPASMAYMNTWYSNTRTALCNKAEWRVSNSSHQCVHLKLWVPSYYAVVTSMTVTITSFLQGQGTWYNYVNVNENAYTGFYDLGNYPYATTVDVYDNQATPVGSQMGVGGLLLAWC